MPNILKYKSIFISDLHLGTKGCQANKILEFFKNSRSENLYLVGDIIDIWEMQKSFFAWQPLVPKWTSEINILLYLSKLGI